MTIVRAGTRRSRLAIAQTRLVLKALESAWPGLRTVITLIDTRGDRYQRTLDAVPGGKGIFTSALEDALRSGDIDVAIHSLKDLPTEPAPRLTLGAVCARATALDALVADKPYTVDSLPARARIGTGSRRRAAQLLHRRRDLEIVSIRGNVETRIGKMRSATLDAVVLAEAGLKRLGLENAIASILPPGVMLPAAGQGALAVQCREDDDDILSLLLAVDDVDDRRATEAERTFLKVLGGGCSVPVAAYASSTSESLRMDAVVASVDGATLIRLSGAGQSARALGEDLAQVALDRGARDILAHV